MLYGIHTLGVLKIELMGSQLDQVEKTGGLGDLVNRLARKRCRCPAKGKHGSAPAV
jgi:hypothetical protein